ncbi:MAG: tRNA-dihydrouridine synthase family protein [Chlorobi bacterium]|nr:tRNA-dihydrouridine synthase family protein [Chlorobiota bacterium]
MRTNPKIYLAPFQGITGSVYREIYARHFSGIDKFFTPFFTGTSGRKTPAAKEKELEKTRHHGIPVVPQILSKDAGEIIDFANVCREKGFGEINWNLGCPFPRVAAKQRGSGLLPYPEKAEEILQQVMPAISLRFSIKCRLGYHRPDEILKLIPVFNRFPVSELIIHARIGKQVYKGKVWPDDFQRALEQSKIPVIYNGDIFSLSDFLEMSERFPEINTWMIGRGILVDPLLPSLIKKEILPGDPAHLIGKFIEDLYYAYRKKLNDRLQAISVMKELWEYMAFSFDDPHKVFKLIKRTNSFDEYEEAVSGVFRDFQWLGSDGRRFDSASIR